METSGIFLAELENLPRDSNAFGRYKSAYVPIAGQSDPTSEPPRKSTRLTGQGSPSGRIPASLKGKGVTPSSGLANPRPRVHRIHTLTVRDELPLSYSQQLLPTIDRTIRGILDRDAYGHPPYEQAQQACHVLVSALGKGAEVYDKIKLQLEQCVIRIHRELFNDVKPQLLRNLVKEWSWYESKLGILDSVFVYLDQLFVGSQLDYQMHVRLLGRSIWHSQWKPNYSQFIRKSLSQWFTYQRDHSEYGPLGKSGSANTNATTIQMDLDDSGASEHADSATIKKLVQLSSTYDQYASLILPNYTRFIKEYYDAERTRVLNLETPAKYFLHASRRVKEERASLEYYCKGMNQGDIMATLDQSMVHPQLDDPKFVGIALADLLEKMDVENLREIYLMAERVQQVPKLRQAFKDHVKEAVEQIVKPENDAEMIERLIQLRARVNKVLDKSFSHSQVQIVPAAPIIPMPGSPTIGKGKAKAPGKDKGKGKAREEEPVATEKQKEKFVDVVDEKFGYAAKDAFKEGLASRKNKPAEMLAKHLDFQMRRGQGDSSDSDFEDALTAALGLYGYMADHDVFRIYYMRALAKRLLLHRSASDDFEKSFLSRLAQDHDPEFEKGLKMFKDLEISRNLTSQFHASPTSSETDAELHLTIFQPSVWPTYTATPLTLPISMQSSLDNFKSFYATVHKERVLTWIHSLGTATVVARFGEWEKDRKEANAKELAVSLHQAVVLILFADESVDSLTYREIAEQTGISSVELRRTLQELSLTKKRVLLKKPQTKDVGDDDVFTFNRAFKDSSRNVRINTIQVQETPEENKAAEKAIDADRVYTVDAAVVRLMKAAKTLSHQDLVNRVIEAVTRTSFTPQPPFIKKRIDALIEQEYLERSEDKGVYTYLA